MRFTPARWPNQATPKERIKTMSETAVLDQGQAKTLNNQDVADTLTGLRVLNVERFNNSFFFNIRIKRGGFRVKVKDGAKLALYLQQLAGEIIALRGSLAAEGLTEKEITKRLKAETSTASAIELDPGTLATLSTGNVVLPKTISTTKALLTSPALDALNEFLTATKQRLCGPFGVMLPSRINEGLFVCPAPEVERVEGELSEAVRRMFNPWVNNKGEERAGYVPEFLADYEAAKHRAQNFPLLKGGLGPLFDAADYPSSSEVAESFALSWGWLAIGVPTGLPEAIRAEATRKFQSQVDEAAAECRQALYVQLGELLNHARERLTVEPGEKQKVFRDSMLENISQFLQVFESRNAVFNDSQLETLVGQVRQTLVGVTPDKLRQYASVRANVTAQFEQITAALDQAVETRKSRKMYLDE
jgi:hypothetical protein